MSDFLKIDPDAASKITEKLIAVQESVQKDMLIKMKVAVNIVYRIAHARRPQISITSQGKNIKKSERVSDPSAEFGVPIRTGELQASIQKDVVTKGLSKVIGKVFTNSPYAVYLEFGTSKMAPRPFMRQAGVISKKDVKDVFRKKPKII